MKKKHLQFLFCTCAVLIVSSFCSSVCLAQEAAAFVNPFIGTGGHGHTFPGATYPYGMVQLSPDTRNDNTWDGCSGYHYDDTLIYGFSHTHLSGTGCSDYGDVLFIPVKEKTQVLPNAYASRFNKQTESARAGYYRVDLQKPEVRVELTSGERSGIQRYTWSKQGERLVLLDLKHRDQVLESSLMWKDTYTISGYRISKAWAKKQHCYFETKLSEPIQSITVFDSGTMRALKPGERISGKQLVFVLQFESNLSTLSIHTGISLCDEAGAGLNRLSEPNSFEELYQQCVRAWNDKLSCISIDSETPRDDQFKFYTALYHVFIQPNIASDLDGRYRGMNDSIYLLTGKRKRYTVFSLWDTYRAVHPLLTIIDPKTVSDLCKTMLDIYKEQGRLPVWELASNETECMIGYHAVSVLLDAVAKDIDIGDKRLALEAMIKTASRPDPGLKAAEEQGFIGIEDDHESVSKTLEYAYNDWCIARFAKLLNCSEDTIRRFYRRSLNYRNLFNHESGFFQPRSNGSWLAEFDPAEVNNHYTEANSWQYSFYVPHDMDGLIALHGGTEKLSQKLDRLFTASTETKGRVQADITGLIGQYAHGNEPSHHIPFLYSLVNRPEKTDRLVQQICHDFYLNAPNGLIGNEDCGQMSAWFVMACLGIYPVCPGNNEYVTFNPWLKNVRIRQNDGMYYSVFPVSPSEKMFVGNRIRHQSILQNINSPINASVKDVLGHPGIPESYSNSFVPAPVLDCPAMSFKDAFVIRTDSVLEGKTLIRAPGKIEFIPLQSNLNFRESGTYHVKRVRGTNESGTVLFNKIARPDSMGLKSAAKASLSYRLNGIESLNDGISGSAEWRKGNWYGVFGQDMQIDVDLLNNESCDLEVGLLQDCRSWIFFPSKIAWYSSQDDIQYHLDYSVDLKDEEHEQTLVKKMISGKATSARYRRIVLTSYGKLPVWHPGAGEPSYIFIDEITKVK